MSTNWNYAQHSKMVSEFGGPEKFVAAIKAGAYAAGKVRGFVLGTAAGAGVMSVVGLGIERYRRIQERAAEAERALLEAMDEQPPVD